jgi:hypothetical protein
VDEVELVARRAVLDAVGRVLAPGGLSLRPAELAAARWRAHPGWLGPLAQTEERALVFVAIDIVARIAASPAWSALDGHQDRLDLVTELDGIDRRAYELAGLRHAIGRRDTVLTQSWTALVDRVAILMIYADRLRALETEAAPAELAEHEVAALTAGWAGDELAADQVRVLAGELHRRAVTNSEMSHRNAT